MEKVELTGWEITINENGVKMATLNHERFIDFLKYNEYLEKQVKLLATPAVVKRSEQLKCDWCGGKGFIGNEHLIYNCKHCNPKAL